MGPPEWAVDERTGGATGTVDRARSTVGKDELKSRQSWGSDRRWMEGPRSDGGGKFRWASLVRKLMRGELAVLE